MNDLQEQVKVEHAPTDKNEHGQEVSIAFFPVTKIRICLNLIHSPCLVFLCAE